MKGQNPLFFLFKRLSWPYGLIIAAVIISSLGSISGLLIPLFTGRLVDKFSTSTINWNIVLLFAGIFIANALLSGIGIYLLSKIGEKMIYDIRSILWEHIIKLKMPFFDKNESGQLMSRLTDDTKVINEFISQKLPQLLPAVITLIGSIVMLFIMDWQMTLLTFIAIPIFMAIMIPLALMFGKLADKIGEKKVFLIGTGGLTLFSIIAFMLLHSQSFVVIVIGIFILGFFLSTYEATMPGSLPTMFYSHIRYRTLSVTFNISVSIFGGTTPLVATWLVTKTGDPLAPAYYLTAISVIGFLVITFLHLSTAGKSLKGSYPNVDNEQDRAYYAEHPKEALWWVKERKN